MKATPLYIKNLLLPSAKAPQGRKVWSIDLETVWLPFLLATNTMGDTAVPSDALGCPIRLAYAKDGSVKFGITGRPVTRVAKPISDCVTLIRQNFVANLQDYAEQVADTRKEDYNKQVRIANTAGQPIITRDKEKLNEAIQAQLEEAMKAVPQEEAPEEAHREPEKETAPVG